MVRTVAAVGALVLAGAWGCGGDGTGEGSVRARSTLAMGEKVTLANGETVAVHGYQSGVRPEETGAADGPTFGVIDVEACAGADGRSGAEVGRFQLELADGGGIPPAPVAAKQPPLVPPTGPGQCRRGTVSYEVGPGRRPTAVSFAGSGTTVRWAVG